MKNSISIKQKEFFVKKGKNHAFGTDFEKRESLNADEVDARFDSVWEASLKPAITGGKIVKVDDVRRRLSESSWDFVRADAEHREFRLSDSLWIAQIQDGANDQLWIVSNKAYDTRSIVATFRTQEERNSFDRLAASHGMEPQEYARRILSSHLAIYEMDDASQLRQRP